MRRAVLAGAVIATLCCAAAAQAEIVTISDVQPIRDYGGDGTTLPASLPFALFDFSNQQELGTLNAIEITLTAEDGNTAPGEFDHDNLSLALNGIPTGIVFNGFGNGQEIEQTFRIARGEPGWPSDQLLDQLRNSMYSNGALVMASLIDATPDDNCCLKLYSIFDTTLRLTGDTLGGGSEPIPEPITIAIWGLGVAGLALWSQRGRRPIGG